MVGMFFVIVVIVTYICKWMLLKKGIGWLVVKDAGYINARRGVFRHQARGRGNSPSWLIF